jgi:hypothetical protein
MKADYQRAWGYDFELVLSPAPLPFYLLHGVMQHEGHH